MCEKKNLTLLSLDHLSNPDLIHFRLALQIVFVFVIVVVVVIETVA